MSAIKHDLPFRCGRSTLVVLPPDHPSGRRAVRPRGAGGRAVHPPGKRHVVGNGNAVPSERRGPTVHHRQRLCGDEHDQRDSDSACWPTILRDAPFPWPSKAEVETSREIAIALRSLGSFSGYAFWTQRKPG
ncbi:MAG: hypothetical protein ACLSVD_12015 [Eggerthellaceae bacterium]